jgi:hypothetical protein
MEPIEIISELNTNTMGFSAYTALKNKFDFSLSVGDIVRLNVKIKGANSRSHWTTGLYRVTRVGRGIGTLTANVDDARFHSYWFEKIKKDGTKINDRFYGWNCQSFDHDILGKGMAERENL